MSSVIAVFPYQEFYNLKDGICKIIDIIITKDNQLIIRTTEFYRKIITSDPSVKITGDVYILNKNVFQIILKNGGIYSERYNCTSFAPFRCSTGRICSSVLGTAPIISKHWESFSDRSNNFDMFNNEQVRASNVNNLYSISHQPNNNSVISLDNYIIDDMVDCGSFEDNYINKLDSAKGYINRSSVITRLYKKYKALYDKAQLEKDKNDEIKYLLEIQYAENERLKKELKMMEEKYDSLVVDNELKIANKQSNETANEIKKIWEAIALLQLSSNSNF
jgi:hypothetical protein